jgi:hypothetical protein
VWNNLVDLSDSIKTKENIQNASGLLLTGNIFLIIILYLLLAWWRNTFYKALKRKTVYFEEKFKRHLLIVFI